MNTTPQPDRHLPHPDAEVLNAFAEAALPEHERLHVMAHMADCSHCREIVYLAQEAAGELVPAPAPTPASRSWFMPWRIAWISCGALACVLLVAITLHLRHAAPPQMALEKPVPVPVSAAPAPAKPVAPPIAEDKIKRMPEPRIATAKPKLEVPPAITATNGALPIEQRSFHGQTTLAAPVPPPPPVQQMQYQARAATQQSQVLQQQAVGGMVGASPASKPEAYLAGAAPQRGAASGQAAGIGPAQTAQLAARATSQSVEVMAAAAPLEADSASLSGIAVTNAGAMSASKVARKRTLPSHLDAVATAAIGRRIVAADAAGAVFLSEDAGRHWQLITRQWQGVAVTVRTKSAAEDSTIDAVSSGAESKKKSRAEQLPRPTAFELVTDTGAVWTSIDGKNWSAQ